MLDFNKAAVGAFLAIVSGDVPRESIAFDFWRILSQLDAWDEGDYEAGGFRHPDQRELMTLTYDEWQQQDSKHE